MPMCGFDSRLSSQDKAFEMAENRTSLQSRVKDMQPGDRMTVSIDEFSPTTVYNYCSDLGFELQRVYRTRRDRQARTMEITRES